MVKVVDMTALVFFVAVKWMVVMVVVVVMVVTLVVVRVYGVGGVDVIWVVV